MLGDADPPPEARHGLDVGEVAGDRILQVGVPVEPVGALDVPEPVHQRPFVDLEQHEVRMFEMALEPLHVDERSGVREPARHQVTESRW